jgi:signal transduction histidine kinase
MPVDTVRYANDAAIAQETTARLVLVPDTGPTLALKAGVTRWLLITLGGTLLVAGAIATLLGRVISAPLVALSDRTARLDLDRLDQRFATGRDDELGALERTLDALTGRLRTSVARLREAERAAATGDVARQVNHDIKNGLAPIRNVLRHLGQTAERHPDALAATFLERRGTLESSVAYLDALARNYARLSPTLSHGPTDPRPVVLAVARGVTTAQVEVRLPDALPPVRTDAVVLHRILDNLVSNAVDALEGAAGTVTVGAEAVDDADEPRVRFTVADTGRGMTREELAHAFDDFHTTKPAGTGLGLSVVRRLLTDVGGSVRAETAPGEGTTFTVEVPAARFQRS